MWYKLSVALDSIGNTYVAGIFYSPTLTFNIGISLTNSGASDVYIAKFNKILSVNNAKVTTNDLKSSINPNPIANTTEVIYTLADDCEIELSLYNLSGIKVLDIANGKQTQGTHKLAINSENLSSGTYSLILRSCGKSITEKVVVVK